MTKIEAREHQEQLKSALTSQEKKVLSLANSASSETMKWQTDSIANANKIAELQKAQAENNKRLAESRRLDAVKNNFTTPQKLINAINALKNQDKSVSFDTFIKRGVVDKNYNLQGFRWTKNDRSEFSIPFVDSQGRRHEKKFASPSKGEIDMVKVFKWLNDAIKTEETKIYANKSTEAVKKGVEDFDTSTLSPKLQAYLKEKKFISTFGSGLDFINGVGRGIGVDKGVLNLGGITKIAVKDVYKNGAFDSKAFSNLLAKALDQKANDYFLNDITYSFNNLVRSKLAITDTSYKNSLSFLDSKIKKAQKFGLKIPENQLKMIKETQEQIKTEENFRKEDARLTQLYEKYEGQINSKKTVVDMVDTIRMIKVIAQRLTAGNLAGFEGKKATSKSYFDKAGKSAQYQAYVKKFQALAKRVEI